MSSTASSRQKGKSKYQPTDEDRKTVRSMVTAGIDQNAICLRLGITVPTLHKWYRREIDTAYTALVHDTRVRVINKSKTDTTALIYLSKVLGWYDKPPGEGIPPPNPFPPVGTTPVEAARRIAFALMAGMTEPKIIDVEESA